MLAKNTVCANLTLELKVAIVFLKYFLLKHVTCFIPNRRGHQILFWTQDTSELMLKFCCKKSYFDQNRSLWLLMFFKKIFRTFILIQNKIMFGANLINIGSMV